jgi:type II restriction enzyme
VAKKHQLRELRAGTVINSTSKHQEKKIIKALKQTLDAISTSYDVILSHESQMFLKDIVAQLRRDFPDVDFHYYFDTSSIRPDGGFLFLHDREGQSFPILISEVKNQGTNTLRLLEGLKKQAKGNAIERLGKNVIGLRTALLRETIFPFVCFGYGCDFDDDSSILDRVVTIAMFGHLRKTYLHNLGAQSQFDRGSFYFREEEWTVDEMAEVMTDIAERSILYYFSKYGKARFLES